MRTTDNIDFCNFTIILVTGRVISFTMCFSFRDILAILLRHYVFPQTKRGFLHLQEAKIIVGNILSP